MFQPFTTKPDGLGMDRHLPIDRRSSRRALAGVAARAGRR
jgi:hypothetical protein